MIEVNEAYFLKDVAEHQIEIIKDDGVYRHIKFASPGTSAMSFELTTWPGHLCYSGDMGDFVFFRLNDMFNFFRTDSESPRAKGETLYINTGYWGEKCVAIDKIDGIRTFSPENFTDNVKDWLEEYLEDEKDEEFKAALTEAVQDELLDYADSMIEQEAREALNDFSFRYKNDRIVEISDTWEWTLTEKSFRFVWCCYAIVWGIMQYDINKATLRG